MTSDQELKGKVAVVLFNADPEGLAVMRCPSDEYDCEAELILDRLHEIAEVVRQSAAEQRNAPAQRRVPRMQRR